MIFSKTRFSNLFAKKKFHTANFWICLYLCPGPQKNAPGVKICVGANPLLGLRPFWRLIATLLIKIFKIENFFIRRSNFILKDAVSPNLRVRSLLAGQLQPFQNASKMAIFGSKILKLPPRLEERDPAQSNEAPIPPLVGSFKICNNLKNFDRP